MYKKLFLLTALASVLSSAFALEPAGLSFDAARQFLYEKSDKLNASEAYLQSKKEASESLKTLGGPTVTVQAAQIAGAKTINIDKSVQLPAQLGGVSIPLSLHEKLSLSGPRASVTTVWPIYTGGKIDAKQQAGKYAVDEAYAQKRLTSEELDAQLAGYYFGVQLARSVEKLQKRMLEQQNKELDRAVRFEKQGVISRIERMSVQVARDNAKRDWLAARDRLQISETQLSRLLRDSSWTKLSTPLFVLKTGLQPLSYWQDLAVAENPQIAILKAKGNQAEQGVRAAEADWHPQVFAFGRYNFIRHYQSLVEPNWLAGIGVNFTLWSARDRRASIRSAEALVRQAEAGKAEAINEVKTGVEVAWLKTQNAIEQYKLSASTVILAKENLELKSKGFGEGLSTALDVTEARNQLLKAEVGRRLAAFEFVSSYAMLHAICGRMSEFMNAFSAKNVLIEN
jgi:outer membrane protein TolC